MINDRLLELLLAAAIGWLVGGNSGARGAAITCIAIAIWRDIFLAD
jgi:hypothetical protein